MASSDPVQRAVADPHEPDFGIRAPGAEALCGSKSILVEGICAGLDVDGNDFAAILRLH